jgi:hypothetical protein
MNLLTKFHQQPVEISTIYESRYDLRFKHEFQSTELSEKVTTSYITAIL